MLELQPRMNIQPDEWLTVAARGRTARSVRSKDRHDVDADSVRIKGSDLALYDADRTQQDEIREASESRRKEF